jgi:hypothetical protein
VAAGPVYPDRAGVSLRSGDPEVIVGRARLSGVVLLLAGVTAALACGSSTAGFSGGSHAGGHDAGRPPTLELDGGGGAGACLAGGSTSSVGCEYYAVEMDGAFAAFNGCYVVFLVNTNESPAHFTVSFDDVPIDLSQFVKIPQGNGLSITYDDFDPVAGLPQGEVAIAFLAGIPEAESGGGPGQADPSAPVACPVLPALNSLTQLHGSGIGRAFHVVADEPVVAYQMLPYGGGKAAVTGASLLLPTAVYGNNYVAVDAYAYDAALPSAEIAGTSMDIVASQDDTHVTIRPNSAIVAAGGISGTPAGTPITYTLSHGEVLQITQDDSLTGSPIQSDRPIGLFAGHPCVTVPLGAAYCDHAEQQIPPISALGHEYLGVTYRQRTSTPENPVWVMIGVADGTTLTWDPPVGGPAGINLSDVVMFQTATPFHVGSQNADHPFLLLSTMTGATTVGSGLSEQGYGDPDVVRVVPVAQYLGEYGFFTDPTYPETNLVVTRARGKEGFSDVTLDCAGALSDWQPIGSSGLYEYTRIDLVRHDFVPQGSCNNGRHEMSSPGPFGVTVWGWGTPETTPTTGYVSYGYPAGENVGELTTIVVK